MKNVNLFTFNRSNAQKNTLCASVNISNASPRDDRDVTETLPRRYGWAKLAATLTLLLTLGVGQMWGWTISDAKVYFDNTNSAYDCGVRFVIEKSDGCCVQSMSLISGTNNLYYWTGTWGDGAVSNLRFASASYTTDWYGWWSNVGNVPTLASAEGFCSYTNTYGTDVNNAYKLFNAASGSSGSNVTKTDLSSYTSLNYTQTLYQCVAENGGTPARSTASIATIGIATKKLNGNSSTTNDNGNISSGQNNVAKSAARTATVTMTATSIADGYTFLGWYNSETGGTQLESSTTYTYQATAAKTVYARFSHETTHTVNITYTCASPSATVSTATSQAIGQVTASSITAPSVTGYTFSSWTLGNGISNQSASTSANPISVKTLSSGTYTMQANYTEDLSSPWIVSGGNKIVTSGTTWRTTADANNSMVKKTGHSTESVVYFTVPVTSVCSGDNNGNFQFKIYNTSTSTWYSLGADGSSYYLLKAEDGTEKPLVTDDGKNIELRAYVTGNYEFKLDYSTSTPKLTVTWPDYNQIRFYSAQSGGSTTNTYDFENTSTSTWTKTVTLSKGTYWFKIIEHSGFFSNSGTMTRANCSNWTMDGTDNNCGFTADVSGDYTFSYVHGTNKLSVTYQAAFQVNFGYGTGGSAVTASSSTDGAISTGDYVKAGDNVTFTQTKTNDGYDFKGWYTAASDGSAVSGMSTSDNVLDAIAATANVYAQYTKHTWTSQTLSKNDVSGYAGTSENGAFSVTYLGTSISITTTPTRSGYTVAGYYKEAANTNLIAASDGKLQASTSYTNSSEQWTRTESSTTLYTKWQQTLTLAGNGANSTAGSLTMTYGSRTTASHTAATRTGYTLNGYYTNTSGGYKVINSDGSLVSYSSNVSSYLKNSSGEWIYNGTPTLSAQWTASKYDVTLKANGGSGSDQVVQATYDAAMPTTLKTGGAAVTVHTKTGYKLLGYWDTSAASGGNKYYDYNSGAGPLSSARTWNKTANTDLFARWQAKTYTVTLSQTGATTTGTPSVTATYAADMPSMMSPTADNGYAFMGYFTAEDGGGTKYYNADGSSAKAWDIDEATTLYAYFKKSQVTDLTITPTVVDLSGTVYVEPVIDPAATVTTHIDWRILYDNNNPLAPQPTITTYNTTGIQFKALATSGTYKVEATYRVGNTPNSGAILNTYTKSFQVAGDHTVTVRYMCGSYAIQPATSVTGKPLAWTEITAPDLTGYTFTRWVAGDGITIEGVDNGALPDTATTATIRFKAIYDGTLKAEYTKKSVIYFNNTVGWEHVYAYFYTGTYWSDTYGSGAKYDQDFSGQATHYRHFWGEMTQIPGTNIWYLDYQAKAREIDPTYGSEIDNNTYYYTVAFTKDGQGYPNGDPASGYQWFNNTEAVYRGDFKHEMPMYVPIPEATKEYNKHDGVSTVYYTDGYWMNYPENTGYELVVFDNNTDGAIKTCIPFEFNADKTMPMTVKVDLEAAKTYGFMIHRIDGYNAGDGSWYGNGGTMTATTTGWDMKTGKGRCGVSTTAAGDYEFILNYFAVNDDYQYRATVIYPIAVGDYRVLYKDNVHTTWKPSAVIPHAALKDTVSFFVRKTKSPVLKLQKCTALGDKTVTWEDTVANLISSLPAVITQDSVYNFCLGKGAGNKLVLENTEAYTGNYYIRTDVAGTTKWDNYKADDHLMQYSDYAAANEDFTHYFVHWVRHGRNVKFVIANDYSPCISDTLIKDDPDLNNMDEYGNLYVEDGKTDWESKYSANIRFMWNQGTNAISRAYVNGSSNINNFIIMRGPSSGNMIYNESGNRFTAANTGLSIDDAINLRDDQNFIYETTIKANPQARIKLTANYNGTTQYFKGDDDASFTGEHGVEILGGTIDPTDKEKMRIVYDFKTNRLVCAWLPSDTIKANVDINADVMIIREHQEEAQQITFAGSGTKLGQVKSVYGVMRFNRWTLANKSKESGHAPLASPKSNYERQIYYISFPFDVNLGDIFGLGRYDDLWWIDYYDGEERAQKGYFKETKTFWKFMENTPNAKLEANVGYVLMLDEAMLHSDDENIWTNNIEQVELFFPSASVVTEIEKKNAEITLTQLPCTLNINPSGKKEPDQEGYDPEKDRRKRDSHWHCIGVPSYANYSEYVKDADGNNLSWSTWGPENEGKFPFLYTWNMTDNTLSPTASAKYGFKTMNAYLVQYEGTIKWSAASAPKSIAARRNANWKSSYMFRLELQKENQKTEQTLINLSDAENVSAAFDFNYDLSNEGGAIYTTTSDLVTVAGNCLPLVTDQQTTVPVGVIAKTTGEYTFAMPDGTEGLSVTLVDNFTGAHANLALGDYTVELEAGTYEERFTLVIDPRTTTTAVETVGGESVETAPRKVFINGLMYIQRGSNLYDAQGRKVN